MFPISSLSRLAKYLVVNRNRLQLDLSGLHVITEAATGPYSVTPVLAALAGAQVVAFTQNSSYGTVSQVRAETMSLAKELSVCDKIQIVESLAEKDLAAADILTNSGHLRPITAHIIDCLKQTAVIPLMYEAWEFRNSDLDLESCRRRGIRVVGTNERHPDVNVFCYLGLVVLKAMLDADHNPIQKRCLLLCDNDFGPFVRQTLVANGAQVTMAVEVDKETSGTWDTVIVARTPPAAGGTLVRLDGLHADLFCQLWGDVDRSTVAGRWCPQHDPLPGHMGLTLQSLGSEPIVRLQAGGLKAAEAMVSGLPERAEYFQQVLGAQSGLHGDNY